MKCIFKWQITDGYTYSFESITPFECDDLEDFILKSVEKVQKSEFGDIVLDCRVSKSDIDYLYDSFFTLEEWFEKSKYKKITNALV